MMRITDTVKHLLIILSYPGDFKLASAPHIPLETVPDEITGSLSLENSVSF